MPLGELTELMPDLVEASRAKLEHQALQLLEDMNGAVESLQSAADGFRCGVRGPARAGACAAAGMPMPVSRGSRAPVVERAAAAGASPLSFRGLCPCVVQCGMQPTGQVGGMAAGPSAAVALPSLQDHDADRDL